MFVEKLAPFVAPQPPANLEGTGKIIPMSKDTDI